MWQGEDLLSTDKLMRAKARILTPMPSDAVKQNYFDIALRDNRLKSWYEVHGRRAMVTGFGKVEVVIEGILCKCSVDTNYDAMAQTLAEAKTAQGELRIIPFGIADEKF